MRKRNVDIENYELLTNNVGFLETDYAGFWLRLLAHFIDGLIVDFFVLIQVAIVAVITGLSVSTIENRYLEIVRRAAFMIAVACTTWIYYALMESSSIQGTLGKMSVGIKVTDLEGNRITFGRASARHWSKIVSGLTFSVGYIMAGFTEKKQALHDMLADCLVLKKR